MRRLIAAAALLLAPALFAHDHSQNISISTDDYEDVTSCSQIRVTFDHQTARCDLVHWIAQQVIALQAHHERLEGPLHQPRQSGDTRQRRAVAVFKPQQSSTRS